MHAYILYIYMHVCMHVYMQGYGYIGCVSIYTYTCMHTHACVHICICACFIICIYGHALRGPPHAPQMIWKTPLFCGVGSGGWESPSLLLSLWCGVLWVGIPLPASLACRVGSCGWEGIPSFPPLWCGVCWVGIPLPPPGGVGFGGVEFVLGTWWAWGGREGQTIFCWEKILFCDFGMSV